jgi:hypothetical protein
MPVFPSAFARRMSAVVCTGVIRSALSVNQRFHRAMLRIVSANPSQIEQVQFAAVNPPLRMSAKTSRLHFEMTRPSMTMSESCIPVMQVPEERRGAKRVGDRLFGPSSSDDDRRADSVCGTADQTRQADLHASS